MSPVSFTNSQIEATVQRASSEQVSLSPWMMSAALGVGTTVGSLTPGSLSSFGAKTSGSKQMQTVSLAHLPVEEFEKPLLAFFRIRVNDGHHILRRIAIAESGSPANFDKRREPGPDYAGLRLEEGPGVQHRIHPLVRCLALEASRSSSSSIHQAPRMPHRRVPRSAYFSLMAFPADLGPTPSMKTRRFSSPGRSVTRL